MADDLNATPVPAPATTPTPAPPVVQTRYPFPVPEWCRVIWASPKARALWEPRLTAIGRAWTAVEMASVGQLRSVCRLQVLPDQLPALTAKAAVKGLTVVALAQEPVVSGYRASSRALRRGEPWAYQIIMGRPRAVAAFLDAYKHANDGAVGDLLGYPACCREFYQRTWVEAQWRDTTWPMAVGSPCRYDGDYTVRVVEGPVECNILLRWLGVRWVPHLPCSFACEGTRELGAEFRALLRPDCPQEAEWMDELLSSPVEWSGWHGIAEIRHPLLKVSTKTDATPEKLVVRRPGERWPEDGVKGGQFPYDQAPRPEPVAVPIPIDLQGSLNKTRDPLTWTDNGFRSQAAMEAAHSVILAVAAPLAVRSVVDLGCGNGLLARLVVKDGYAYGIEQDPGRAERAKARLDNCDFGRIEDLLPANVLDYDLILLMPGRLREMDRGSRETVIAHLRTARGRLLVYSYDHQNIRDLASLCFDSGLTGYLHSALQDKNSPALAGLWNWS